MKSLICLLISMVFVPNLHSQITGPAAPTRSLVAYLYMVNGVFTEGQQLTCDQLRLPEFGNQPSIRIRPFDIPDLYPEWAIYFAAEYNATIINEEILGVREETDGTIRVTVYRLLNRPVRVQGEFGTEPISSLTLADLNRRDDCEGVFVFQPPNVFTGTWPQCGPQVQQNNPRYNSTITCDAWPLTGLQPSYNYQRVPSCEKYPMIPYMVAGPQFPDPCPGPQSCGSGAGK